LTPFRPANLGGLVPWRDLGSNNLLGQNILVFNFREGLFNAQNPKFSKKHNFWGSLGPQVGLRSRKWR